MMEGHTWGLRSHHCRANPNTVTECRCPPPTPHLRAASSTAFRSGQRSRTRSIRSDALSLEARRGGVNQTLTDDPTAKLLPLQRKWVMDCKQRHLRDRRFRTWTWCLWRGPLVHCLVLSPKTLIIDSLRLFTHLWLYILKDTHDMDMTSSVHKNVKKKNN